ncbi:MAG: immune inhibitor A, partial [Candidatus Marinimicrobia bacterium]|nr:immune inhibitor A [Candidatus Neomarinimicrobiota bacterium]
MLRKSVKIVFINLTLIAALWAQAEVLTINNPTSGETIDTSVVTVSFTLATYFAIGDSGCADCDGFIRTYLNNDLVYNATSTADFEISDVIDGNYMLTLEAVDPDGDSFDPAIEDTVSFNVIGNPSLCNPYDLIVYPGDGRNSLEWSEPVLGASGGIGCGDFVINGLPFTDQNTNVGMGDDWDVTFSDGEDVAYTLNLSVATTIDVTLCDASTTYDTKLEIFTFDGTDCSLTYTDALTTGDYNDDFTCSFSNLQSSLMNVTLAAGQYYIVVDGFGGQTGNYGLSVTESTGRSMAQNTQNDFDLELIKSGLNPDDLFADFERLNVARNSTRDIDVLCGTFVQYNVYDESDNSLVGSSDTTFFIHDNLTNDSTYCYYVTAEYSEGESANSDTACATPAAFIAEPVTNLMATPLDEEVALSWTEPGAPTFVVFTSFEGTDGGFIGSGGFERGVPTAGPSGAGSGAECWGTYLNSDYDNSMFGTLTSPEYDLSGMTNPLLQINHWYNIESYYDGGNVKISDDSGATWTVLTPTIDYPEDATSTANAGIPGEAAYSGAFIGNFWHTVQFDLSSYDTSSVMFRFDFGSDGSVTYEGWYIDDFALMENSTGRENDGDLTHYNVYQDGVLVEDSVEVTGYLITGLTNATAYTFSVSAGYYPNYESDTVSISTTPTWLYGDISGTITDPAGATLDSAIVYTGSVKDTTGSDGTYFLGDLDPGVHTVRVTRDGFDWSEADVTVIAQEAAVTQDFEMIPVVGVPWGLQAHGDDHIVHLAWRTPGGQAPYDLAYYDDNLEAQIGCGGGCEFGVRFTPLGYPATLTDLLVSVQGDASAISANIVAFLEPNGDLSGPEGLTPIVLASGVDLSGIDGNFTQYTIDVSAANLEITSGDVYIMILENGSGFMGIANDILPQSPEFYDRNWVFVGGAYSTIYDYFGYPQPDLVGDFGLQATFFGVMGRSTLNSANEEVQGASISVQPTREGEFANVSSEPQVFKEHIIHDQVMPFLNVASASNMDNSRSEDLTGYNVFEILANGDSVVTTISGSDTTTDVTVPSNYTEYCYAVSALWDHSVYGALESKKSSIACTTPYLPGDIDFNDAVDVSDLLACV